MSGGPRVAVSTAAFHARVRALVPDLGGLKKTKMFLPHPRVEVSIVGSLRDREVACSASDRQGSNFESCVWRTVSSQSPHHPQDVLLAQFSFYVHKGSIKPIHLISFPIAGFDEFNLLLAQPDPSDFKVMSHIIPCPNDIRRILKKNAIFWLYTAVSRKCHMVTPYCHVLILQCYISTLICQILKL